MPIPPTPQTEPDDEDPVEPILVPELTSVETEGNEIFAGREASVRLRIKTKDIVSGTTVYAKLLGLAGEVLSTQEVNLNHNQALVDVLFPSTLPAGEYTIQVQVGDLEKNISYSVKEIENPKLETVLLGQSHHVAGAEAQVRVSGTTKFIADQTEVKITVTDAVGVFLPKPIRVVTAVKDDAFDALLVLPEDLPEGRYQILAETAGLVKVQEYQVQHRVKPEILEVKANKYAVSYGYSDHIQIHLKLKDIPSESEMKVVLINEAGLPVEGYDEHIVKTVDNAWEYSYALSPLAVGKYFIHVELVGNETVSTDIDLKVSDASAGWKEILDYSQKNDQLYWFDELNRAYAYTDPNSPFDPKKPTMIFIHGWQNGEVAQNRAPDFNYEFSVNGQQVRANSAKAWIDAGYNVGVYNWVQIADEPGEGFFGATPYSAEAKIWTTNYQYYKRPMRYRLSDGSFINETEKTAPELFVEKYLDAMKGYQGDFITFGGHSLGNQMVLRATALIMERVNRNEADRAIVPDQLTLFDPYYAGNTDRFAVYKTQTKTTTARAGAAIAADLAKQNIVIDMYKSSDLTTSNFTGDVNKPLENVAAYNQIYPDMFGFLQQAQKHSAAYQFYYWGKVSGNDFYMKNPAEIASLMGSYFRIEQSESKDTLDPSDDKGMFKNSGSYVPVKDIILQDEQGGVLEKTAADDHAVLTVASGAYTRVKASVTPSNASAKVVVIEKAGGDLDAVQLAYDGYIKGVQPGTTLLKAIVVTRDAAGNKTGTIEKYFSVEVQ